jgi:cytoskeletal protein CcmA (bactofilin family)
VRCLHCGCEQKVYEDAISTTCGLCGRHLDVGSYLIRGRFGKKICTQGDVFFAKGSLYVGSELMGRRVFVGGDLRTGVRALEVIEIQEGGRIRGPLQAPVVRVAPRADSSVRGIISKELKVAGTLIVEGKVSAQRIEVEKGGILEAKEVITVALRVAPGAGFHSTLLVLSEAPELQDLAALDLATGQWHGSKA